MATLSPLPMLSALLRNWFDLPSSHGASPLPQSPNVVTGFWHCNELVFGLTLRPEIAIFEAESRVTDKNSVGAVAAGAPRGSNGSKTLAKA